MRAAADKAVHLQDYAAARRAYVELRELLAAQFGEVHGQRVDRRAIEDGDAYALGSDANTVSFEVRAASKA